MKMTIFLCLISMNKLFHINIFFKVTDFVLFTCSFCLCLVSVNILQSSSLSVFSFALRTREFFSFNRRFVFFLSCTHVKSAIPTLHNAAHLLRAVQQLHGAPQLGVEAAVPAGEVAVPLLVRAGGRGSSCTRLGGARLLSLF